MILLGLVKQPNQKCLVFAKDPALIRLNAKLPILQILIIAQTTLLDVIADRYLADISAARGLRLTKILVTPAKHLIQPSQGFAATIQQRAVEVAVAKQKMPVSQDFVIMEHAPT